MHDFGDVVIEPHEKENQVSADNVDLKDAASQNAVEGNKDMSVTADGDVGVGTRSESVLSGDVRLTSHHVRYSSERSERGRGRGRGRWPYKIAIEEGEGETQEGT